jgi:phosphoribosylglycinamide formyltransferase 1
MKKIAVFASGSGSNAQQLIAHTPKTAGDARPAYEVALIVTNKAQAGVTSIAEKAGIPVLVLEKDRFFMEDAFVPVLQQAGIEWIVLAGFLWKVPPALIAAYPQHIINIHPALLPKFGGRGMYGRFVHEAVLAAGESESGITIHYVDELYDHGQIIFQATCPVTPADTPESLAAKVQSLEHAHYAKVLAELSTLARPNAAAQG